MSYILRMAHKRLKTGRLKENWRESIKKELDKIIIKNRNKKIKQ